MALRPCSTALQWRLCRASTSPSGRTGHTGRTCVVALKEDGTMHGEPGEPTAYRIEDPGVRALFSEASRYQAWLDVEAALAQAQAELGIIPPQAAEEITRKAYIGLLNLDNIRAGLARTGHSLVPLIWELDRVCDGDAGGYVHWGATTQNITQTGQLLLLRRAHDTFLAQLASLLRGLA